MNRELLMLLLSPTQPRRIKTIENVLTKHKTTSTLFRGMCYDMLGFYGLIKTIDSSRTHRLLKRLIQANLVQVVVEHTQPQYLLTTTGADWIHKLTAQLVLPIELRQNINYDLLKFRRQFLFAVQVTSELSYQNGRYTPMFNDMDAQSQIKAWLHHVDKTQLASQFTDLLTAFLITLPKAAADSFASALNGHQLNGLTTGQRAAKLQLAPTLLGLTDLSLFNHLATFLLTHQTQYPAIYQLLLGVQRSLISASALATYQAYQSQSHPDLTLIARHRRLQPSTVKDHLYEVAMLLPQTRVKLSQFVAQPKVAKLAAIYHGDVNEWHYDKELLEAQQIDFFDYRMFQIFRGRLNESN